MEYAAAGPAVQKSFQLLQPKFKESPASATRTGGLPLKIDSYQTRQAFALTIG